ncbi:MAG: hypothetical protein NVSMB27_38000 [Ktedonobacteraceae bacterium]
MTEQQSHHEHIVAPAIMLEIVPEDSRDADVVAMGELGRRLIADLTQEGYSVHPVETGQCGGLEILYEVVQTVGTLAEVAWQHKDILDTASSLYTMFVAASPLAVRLLYKKGEHHTSTASTREHDPEVKVSIKLDGAEIAVTSRDVENDERVRQLAEHFLAAHPATKLTP